MTTFTYCGSNVDDALQTLDFMRAEAFQPFICIVRRLGLNGQSCPQFVPKMVSPNLGSVAARGLIPTHFQRICHAALYPPFCAEQRRKLSVLKVNSVMHRFAQGLSSDLAVQLAEQVVRMGLPALPAIRMRALADYLIAVSLAAIEAHLDGRGPTVRESTYILAVFTTGACEAVFTTESSRTA